MIPRATYRLQFHRDFPFARAQELVPYFAGLGISHLYASPITTARSGSAHGYDVVDPTRINPELGGEDGLRALVSELRRHDMGLIVDIVPNHMGIAGGENAWWNDVLSRGRESPYAEFFDIDWEDKLLLPFLGEPVADALEHGALELRRGEQGSELWAYGEHRFPLRPQDRDAPLDSDIGELLERQHYRLCWWRRGNDDLHWRRFFTVNELASLRVECPEVFEATHALFFGLYEEGLIDGVRVDHVDGLADPEAYCRALRQRLGPRAYIIVEKILTHGETLPTGWQIDGTTGYDFMEQVSALLHNPAGEEPLGEYWARTSGRPADFAAEELQARQDMLSWEFEAQLSACVQAFSDLASSDERTRPLTDGMLRRALRVLLWTFPAYRTYGTGSASPASDEQLRQSARERAEPHSPPGEMPILDQVLAWLAGEGPGDPELAADAVRRFQQLSAPVSAKSVEDTAFYRYGRLLSRNDVGFDPARFAPDFGDFARSCAQRAQAFPHAMLASATHDHKRGEDVRARLAVLSDVPERWIERVEHWERLCDAEASEVDPGDRYMLYQMLFGAWPDQFKPGDGKGLQDFAARIAAWQEKALREAKLRSSWADPDQNYEAQCLRFAERLLDPARSPELLGDIAGFVADTGAAALANTLVQTALKYTIPGVPDLYQGTELTDLSLVDPDNRRPVDYDLRQRLLASEAPANSKFGLISDLLQMRRAAPALFSGGDFVPATVEGEYADRVFAFRRSHGEASIEVAVALRLGAEMFGRSEPIISPEEWRDTGVVFATSADRRQSAAELFARGPVSLRLTGSPQ